MLSQDKPWRCVLEPSKLALQNSLISLKGYQRIGHKTYRYYIKKRCIYYLGGNVSIRFEDIFSDSLSVELSAITDPEEMALRHETRRS